MLPRWEGASSSLHSVLGISDDVQQVGIPVVSYTDGPQGGVFHFLMRSLAIVVLLIVVMLSNDLVIVLAPFYQRNRAFKYKLGSLL